MYNDINDFELLDVVSDNEYATDTLFKKYRPLIEKIARGIYYKNNEKNMGLELNDLIQEGMIGLSIAINTFNEKKDTSFFTFARLCIIRRIISSVQAQNGLKHQLLNESLSVDGISGRFRDIERVFSDYESDPENLVIIGEDMKELMSEIKLELTNFECEVFELRMAGFNYKEIAELLDKSPKSVDNAINRIKAKVSNYLEEKSKL